MPQQWRTPPDRITVKEAAFRLNVSADTILRWCAKGLLEAWQPAPGCSVLITSASFDQLAGRRYTPPARTPANRRTRRHSR
jgi:excisionase family DNA binding protein